MSNVVSEKIELISPDYAHKLCRSCLCEVYEDYFCLEGYYLGRNIIEIYKNVTSIKIDSNDNLPKKLCITCYDHIIKFDLFKTKVLESEKLLTERASTASTQFFDDEMEIKIEDIVKTENQFESDDAIGSIKEYSDSKHEIFIAERLLTETEPDDTQKDDIKDIDIITECYNTEVPNVLKVMPKAKFKNQTKGNYKEKVSDNSLKEKQKCEKRKESCKDCGKMLLACKVGNHMRTHTKEKPYGCERCSAHFAEKSKLTRHMKIHGNDRAFKCEICGKGFLTPSSRTIHEVTAHNSEKNILCSICGKDFKHQYSLNKHMSNIHNDAKMTDKQKFGKMSSGHLCQYFNCRISRRLEKVKMFKFPYKNEELCQRWIVNSGNAQLIGLKPEELKRKHLCEKHFTDNDYKTEKKHHLKNTAIPKEIIRD